jgi:hypothetical protein
MTQYGNLTTPQLESLLKSNVKHLEIAKNTFLFRDDVDTIQYNIQTMTEELVARGAGLSLLNVINGMGRV